VTLTMKLHPNMRRARWFVLCIGVMAIAIVTAGLGFGVRWNPTSSLPPGLYRVVSADTDTNLIAFCPTGSAQQDSILRGYRPKGMQCADHYAPIMKPIAARSGDIVTVTKKGISVNGKALPNTQQFAADNKKRAMNVWPEGTYAVAPGTVWVLSTYSKYSYDSRYYGPIELSQVIAHVKPLWTQK
jgi:conjugative transfer signal peptidase TraF